jgi:hypothetical protein
MQNMSGWTTLYVRLDYISQIIDRSLGSTQSSQWPVELTRFLILIVEYIQQIAVSAESNVEESRRDWRSRIEKADRFSGYCK